MEHLPRALTNDGSGSSTNTGIIGHIASEGMAPALAANVSAGWTNRVAQMRDFGIGNAPKGLTAPGSAAERDSQAGRPAAAGGRRRVQGDAALFSARIRCALSAVANCVWAGCSSGARILCGTVPPAKVR